MPGTNELRQIAYVNASWVPGRHDGAAFELVAVTEDEAHHTLPVPASQMASLLALTQVPGVVLLWDPAGPTLIAANLVGEWIQPDWPALERAGSTDETLR